MVGDGQTGSVKTRNLQPVRLGRLVGMSLAALMTLAACGPSDGAADDAVSTEVPGESAAPSEPAALENSSELVTVGAVLPQLDNGVADPAAGTAAPTMTGQQFDNTDISIGGATDGPTMLVFLAHWCPHCNDEIPEILELRDNGDLPADLNVVGISTAVASDRDNFPPSQWIDDQGWEWPVLADTESAEAFQAFGGNGFPFTVLLDADGNVLARKSGSSDAAQIKSWIDASLPRA